MKVGRDIEQIKPFGLRRLGSWEVMFGGEVRAFFEKKQQKRAKQRERGAEKQEKSRSVKGGP